MKIKTNGEYEEALQRIFALMQKKLSKGSDRVNELEALSILVKKYEAIHYPVSKPNSAEAIRFRKEQMGLMK